VLNLAAGGATVKEIAGQIYLTRDIRTGWLLINGGLNDLLFDAATPQQIEADFCALFRRIQGERRVIVTLAPFVADMSQATRIDAANRVVSRLCAERGYEVVDLNPAVSNEGARLPAMTNDGLHFTAQAESVWLEAIRRKMAPAAE
jgi:lysophospholipase L1-like esterase